MNQLAIIYMPADSLLFVLNNSVRNTWVIWVEGKIIPLNCLLEFPVIQQASNDSTINCIQAST
jgi:hypothetical protein